MRGLFVSGLVCSVCSALSGLGVTSSLGAEFFGLDLHFPLQKGAGADLTGG